MSPKAVKQAEVADGNEVEGHHRAEADHDRETRQQDGQADAPGVVVEDFEFVEPGVLVVVVHLVDAVGGDDGHEQHRDRGAEDGQGDAEVAHEPECPDHGDDGAQQGKDDALMRPEAQEEDEP